MKLFSVGLNTYVWIFSYVAKYSDRTGPVHYLLTAYIFENFSRLIFFYFKTLLIIIKVFNT